MSCISHLSLLCLLAVLPLHGSEPDQTIVYEESIPFSGKVIRPRVRLRLGPSIDSAIIDELNRGDFFLITGEKNDFYEVQPPKGFKAHIFRTFVLEGIIEGSRVNVRIGPHLDSPVLAQLNTGDKVEGTVSEKNPKWLEITPPESVKFYIAKEYIEKVGGADLLPKMERRKEEVEQKLADANERGEAELQKTFTRIQLDPITNEFQQIIEQYPDFPNLVKEAKKSLASLQERFLDRKLAYFESQLEQSKAEWTSDNEQMKETLSESLTELSSLEKKLDEPIVPSQEILSPATGKWEAIEQERFIAWANEQEEPVTLEDYYAAEELVSFTVSGKIERYDRPVKNKPGDFMLIRTYNNLPEAYLYSTFFDLNRFLDKELTLVVVKRDNQHFAYPAYLVLDIK